MITLPDCILDIIYKYIHQIKLLDSMKLIKQSGHSYFEDLPDLFNNDVIFSYNISNETCGYSERVSEFYNSIIISKKKIEK